MAAAREDLCFLEQVASTGLAVPPEILEARRLTPYAVEKVFAWAEKVVTERQTR